MRGHIEISELTELSEEVKHLRAEVATLTAFIREQFPPKEKRYTIAEVCELYKVSKQTVHNWFKLGLKKEKLGNKVYITESELTRFRTVNPKLQRKLLQLNTKQLTTNH